MSRALAAAARSSRLQAVAEDALTRFGGLTSQQSRWKSEDPKPGAPGKGGGETSKPQPDEDHTKHPEAAEQKSKDPESKVENPIADLNANTAEGVNTPDDKEPPKSTS